MHRFIRGVIANSPAMNTLAIAILVVGTICFVRMRREIFPEFDLDMVLVSVPYPGASPEEIAEGICQKIEEVVQTIDGIKKVTSVAKENAGNVIIELRRDVRDSQKVVNEVRAEVDRIPSFPDFAEDPEVQLVTFRNTVIKVSVMAPQDARGEEDALQLREMAEQVRSELLQLPAVSQVDIGGALDYQIDVEISEDQLRKHGLSLQRVAQLLRRENIDVPAGTLRADSQEILVRGKNKRSVGTEIAKLPLVTDPSGIVLTVEDVGHVRDAFVDSTAITETNGRLALVLNVQITSTEDLLRVTDEVSEYVESRKLMGGYELVAWGDQSTEVRDRLKMLLKNGWMGLVLVFFVLAVFLELRLAFWVALGIPVSIAGAGALLLGTDQTLNVLSTFSFLMALGIIVDDAIVVGENVFAHREMNKGLVEAAVDGTCEVLPAVTTSVITTIIAFCPLLFVSGIMGKFIAVMPLAVIAMLFVSLFESLLILPCHLAHGESVVFRLIHFFFAPLAFLVRWMEAINAKMNVWLNRFVDGIYAPALVWCVRHPWSIISGGVAMLLLTGGFVMGGFVNFIVFPKEDSSSLQASVRFPDGTPAIVADQTTRRMVEAYRELDEEYGYAVVYHRSVGSVEAQAGPRTQATSGSHVGIVEIELIPSDERTLKSSELNKIWREKVGPIAGVESVTFGTSARGPGGKAIEFKLLAETYAEKDLDAAVEACKAELRTYQGVYDVTDDSQPGKWEFQVALKDKGRSTGVSSGDIADTLRASFYGAEVMRLQRGRHEVKLMVRYPPEERHSLADLKEIRVRTGDGEERPLTELAEISVVRGYSEINRLYQKRSVTLSADVDDKAGNSQNITDDLRAEFLPNLVEKYPGISVSWEGQYEQTMESIQSLFRATGIALLVMFALLTFQFKSQVQPVIIMCIIPFGVIGAVIGHYVMGIPLQLFSFFGIVALTGVVVNDSIVLIDFMNSRIAAGIPTEEAIIEGACRRFRPVLLTSATTIAGLLPILSERSLQAQIVIPMATSLAYGLLSATVLVLVLVPTMYAIYRSWLPAKTPEHEEIAREPVAAGAT